jgi:hypothetical protein
MMRSFARKRPKGAELVADSLLVLQALAKNKADELEELVQDNMPVLLKVGGLRPAALGIYSAVRSGTHRGIERQACQIPAQPIGFPGAVYHRAQLHALRRTEAGLRLQKDS